MHSIAAVRSSSGAADYFASDNYYTPEENAEAGVWGWRGCACALGLERVRSSGISSRRILNGRLPDGEMVGQVEGRRLGLDLTFSMPKSASILALVSRRSADPRCAPGCGANRLWRSWSRSSSPRARNYERSRSGEPREDGQPRLCLCSPMTRAARSIRRGTSTQWSPTSPAIPRAPGRRCGTARSGRTTPRSASSTTPHFALSCRSSATRLRPPASMVRSRSRACLPRSSRPSRPGLQRDRGQDRRNRRHQLSRPRSRSRSTPAIPNWSPRIAARWSRAGNNAPPNLGFDGKALVAEAKARASSAGPAHISRDSHGRRSARVASGSMRRMRTPSPLAVSGAAALFLPAETIKAQHATASAIRHLSEREAAFSPQAILASALGFQIKGLEGGAVVQRIGELVREGHLIPGKSDRLDGHYDLVTTPAALAREQQILDRSMPGHGAGPRIHGARPRHGPASGGRSRTRARAGRGR
jgi:hypothetical protein